MLVIFTTWRRRLEGMWLEASSGKKLDTISTKKLSMVVHACHLSYLGNFSRKIEVHSVQGIHLRPFWKNT
jgi:hypothetical protein